VRVFQPVLGFLCKEIEPSSTEIEELKMSYTLVNTQTIIARNAGALYGLEVGNANMTSYVTQVGSATDAFLNTVYTNSVGMAAPADVAKVLIANLGITGDITDATSLAGQAKAYIVGQLNAVAYTARGAAVNNILSLFSNLSSDPVFGAAATAWNNKVGNAVSYAATDGTVDTTFANVSPTPLGQTFTLTSGIDTVPGTAGNDTINAPLGTLSSLDNIDGGAGVNTANVVFSGNLATDASGSVVKNIQVANLTAAAAITAADVSSWTGLQTLNIAGSSTIAGVAAAATADINVANGLSTVSVDGGNNVSVTGKGTISVGGNTAAAGNVTATQKTAAAIVGVKGAGALAVTSKDGAVTFTNGTSVSATAADAIAQATLKADTDAQTAAGTALTAATNGIGTYGTDASGKAANAAVLKVTNLTTLQAAIAAATNVSADQSTALSVQNATNTAYLAKAIAASDKIAIDAAFASGLVTSQSAARTAAQGVLTSLQTAATAASTAAIAADVQNDAAAAAAKAAADAVVSADATKSALVNDATVVATTNTALASATIKGNYGAATTQVGTGAVFQNAVYDGSTLANTLTTVTLENTGATELKGQALTNVSATGMSGSVTVVNTTPTHAETFTLSGITGGTYTAGATATTVNIVSNGAATNVLNGLSAGTATSIVVTGAAGVKFGGSTGAAAAVIDASGNSGTNTITVLAGQNYKGGTGNDVVTTAGGTAQSAVVDGGSGTADRLNLANATDFGTAAAAANFKNFEILSLASGVSVADVTAFTGSTFTSEVLNGGVGVTLGNLNATQAANITVTADGTYTIGVTGAATVGQLDTVNINVNDGLTAVNTVTLTTPVLAGVETLNLTATDNISITALTSATALTNLNITGAGTVNIVSNALALNVNSVIDASADNAATTLDFSLATQSGISLKAGNGNNVLKGSDVAAKGNLITSGNGNSTIQGGQADDVITAGNGNNTIHGAAGANTITVGDGNNTIDNVASAGANKITAGNGWNVIAGGSGADTITVGTGGNLVTGGAGADKITFGAHVAGVIDGLVYSAVIGDSGALITANGAVTGLDVITGMHAGDTINTQIATVATLTNANAGTFTAATTLDNAYAIRGTYDGTAGTFTASATGADTLVEWNDHTGGASHGEAIVLVGYANVAATSISGGLITLG
jgi:hypothetical protein